MLFINIVRTASVNNAVTQPSVYCAGAHAFQCAPLVKSNGRPKPGDGHARDPKRHRSDHGWHSVKKNRGCTKHNPPAFRSARFSWATQRQVAESARAQTPTFLGRSTGVAREPAVFCHARAVHGEAIAAGARDNSKCCDPARPGAAGIATSNKTPSTQRGRASTTVEKWLTAFDKRRK